MNHCSFMKIFIILGVLIQFLYFYNGLRHYTAYKGQETIHCCHCWWTWLRQNHTFLKNQRASRVHRAAYGWLSHLSSWSVGIRTLKKRSSIYIRFEEIPTRHLKIKEITAGILPNIWPQLKRPKIECNHNKSSRSTHHCVRTIFILPWVAYAPPVGS